MTLASDIIRRAYRESNLIPIGQVPNALQMTEGLESLTPIILSTVGNEAGEGLRDLTIGGDFDESDLITDYVPFNTRLVLRTDGEITVGLDPKPSDGQRFAIADTSGGANTFVADANGRQIEGADTVTVDAGYGERQWMYQAATGNWVRISTIAQDDTFPFPVDYDDYFVTMLALRINPRFSQAVTQETMNALARMRSQIRARYGRVRELESDVYPYDLFAYKHSKFGTYDFATGNTALKSPFLPDKGF